jgi:hypothetical protein
LVRAPAGGITNAATGSIVNNGTINDALSTTAGR